MKLRCQFRQLGRGDAAAFELMIYGDIGDFGADPYVNASEVVSRIHAAKPKAITVRIASYGGSIVDGMAIYNALRESGARVTVRVEAMAGSIASVIAMAGDEVLIARNAQMMIHRGYAGAEGDSDYLRSVAAGLDRAESAVAAIYARKTGRTAEEEFALMKQGERYLDAEEAVAAGYADAIYDIEPAQARGVRAYAIAALKHYVPTAQDQAPMLMAWLKRATTPAAVAAIPSPQEIVMNWKTIAQNLGIEVADDADEATIRAAVLAFLGLSEDASDEDIVEAIALRAGEEEEELDPAAAAKARNKAKTKAKGGAPQTLNRAGQISALFTIAEAGRVDKTQLAHMRAQALISNDSVDQVRTSLQTLLAGTAVSVAGAAAPTAFAGEDSRDKRIKAAGAWLLARAALIKRGSEEEKLLSGNPFRGMSASDLARDCLEEAGHRTRGMNRIDMIKMAITHSTSDFPHIFENALHKTLIIGAASINPTWRRFCKVGSLSDFRPHLRYRAGYFSDLLPVNENGEYVAGTLPDAERESIQGKSKGRILNITRDMLINDDMSVFSDIAFQMGQAAERTVEKDVYALLALNGGLGPQMGDGLTLIHANHGNLATGAGAAAPSVAAFDAVRVQMGSQQSVGNPADPNIGRDFLDIRPNIWLGPLSLGGGARVVNNAEYDPDTPNKLQRPNSVRGMYADIVDTPRLTGAPWYSFADPNIEPVIEVAFLDGEQQPQLTQEEDFTTAGMKWRVIRDYATGAIGYRGVNRSPGA